MNQCLADYKISPSDLSGIIAHTANIIFGQQWELPENHPSDECDPVSDTDSDESYKSNTENLKRSV